jgi:hypothetical protein
MSTESNLVEFPEPDAQVQVLAGSGIQIDGLRIESPEIAEAVAAAPAPERPHMVAERLELGFRAAELGRRARDVDSLKMNMERVSNEVIRTIEALPAALARELGGEDGRVSAPIVQAAQAAARQIAGQIDQVSRAVDANVGPGDSALNRRLVELGRLLDPAVDGSAPKQITAAARDLATPDSPLLAAVEAAIGRQVSPLREQVDALTRQIQADEAVSEALEQTTAKGLPFEERVLEECVRWGRATGSPVRHVGGDNRPGDILIDPAAFGPDVGPVVIECRATTSPAGRVPVARDCGEAMATRGASAAIYLCETGRGFAKEIGQWGEGDGEHGPWIATTHEGLTLAIRYVIARQQLSAARASKREIDELAIGTQLQRIRTAARAARDVPTKTGQIRKLLAAIDEGDRARWSEVAAALAVCEELLRLDGEDQPQAA